MCESVKGPVCESVRGVCVCVCVCVCMCVCCHTHSHTQLHMYTQCAANSTVTRRCARVADSCARANSEFVGAPPCGDDSPRPPPGASPNEEGREDNKGVPHTPPPPSDTRYGAPTAGEDEEEDTMTFS